LLLLYFHLLSRQLHRAIGHLHSGLLGGNSESDISQNFRLAWLENENRRLPLCKSVRTDADLRCDSRFGIVKFEKSANVANEFSTITCTAVPEKYRRTRNSIVVHLCYRAIIVAAAGSATLTLGAKVDIVLAIVMTVIATSKVFDRGISFTFPARYSCIVDPCSSQPPMRMAQSDLLAR
jgi:hypothetical protein